MENNKISYHKYKKQGSQYSKTKKSKTAAQVQNISNVKVSLSEIAKDLYKKKVINKPLFKKISLQILGRARLTTLQDSLQTLQQIEYNNKHDKTSDKVRPFQNKNYTIKEMKTLNNEAKQEYNVFCKYVLITLEGTNDTNAKDQAINILDNQLNRGIITLEEYNTFADEQMKVKKKYEYRNITHQIKGLYNIMHKVEEDLKYFINQPYCLKADVVQIIINKLEGLKTDKKLEDKIYRYKGLFERYNYTTHTNEMIFDKAWKAEKNLFQYKAYNMDINNETALECVPNALYKMYGDKSKGKNKYLSAIYKGGMEYVKKMLDVGGFSSELDIIDDQPLYIEDKKGYTPWEIVNFCTDHKIRCFGYDWMMSQFITNKNINVDFDHNLPAFVFYFNDNHIYLINDADTRHALLNCNKENVSVSLLAKEKKKAKFQKDFIIDIPLEEWKTYNNTNIYITSDRLVHNTFYQLACKGDVYNVAIKMSEKEGVVQFMYENKNMVIYNPDIISVTETIKILNQSDEVEIVDEEETEVKEQYVFKNQRIHTLASEFLDKKFGGVPKSTMNNLGDWVFHSEFIKHYAFVGWFNEKPTDFNNVVSYDYNKHYSSCFMGQNVKYGWPIYNIFDEVMTFDGKIEAGFYYIETSNFFPFRGNGFYDADLIDYALKQGIITINDIKKQYKPSNVLKPDHFEPFVNEVFRIFKEPKKALNALFGLFGHDHSNSNSHYFTNVCKYAMMALSQNPDLNVKYIYHDEFNNNTNEPLNIDNMKVFDFLTEDKPIAYHVYNMKRNKHVHNALPFFYKIYNLSALKMHEMQNIVEGTILGIFTDTIIFKDAKNTPVLSKEIGGMRAAKIPESDIILDTKPREKILVHEMLQKHRLTNIESFDISKNKGCFITGEAGTGKSTKCKELQKQIGQNKYAVCTPTHKSSLLVNAVTVYNLFNINPKDNTYVRGTVEKLKKSGIEWIFIDEVSMVNSRVWGILNDIKKKYNFKFILIGDFNQLDPVESKVYNVQKSEVFAEICDGQMLELKTNWRAMNDPEFKIFIEDQRRVKQGKPINFKTYGNKECRKALCWTNKTRNAINQKNMINESKDKKFITVNNIRVFEDLPIISKKTFSSEEYEIKNNEEFNVIDFDNEMITIRSTITDKVYDIKHAEFKHFDLAYCITVHVSQGSTYNFEYSIYEYQLFDKKLMYVAMSRSTQKNNINFCNIHYTLKTGYIYKITNTLNNKIYIGSTKTTIEQRFNEHCKSLDGSPLHKDMQEVGVENFTVEEVKKVDYVDEQTLLICESCYMMQFDSITNNYNTKFSTDMMNLY